MDNLKDRREYFSKEIRRSETGNQIRSKRKIVQTTLELEAQMPTFNIVAIFDEAMDLSLPVDDLIERMRRLRQLTSCDSFSLPPESASNKLMEFFAKLLKYEEPELLEEATWCLINLTVEVEFSEIDPTPVVLALNPLINPSRKISLLENIFSLIHNISVTEGGAMVLLYKLNFKEVENVVQAHMTLLNSFFTFMAEMLYRYPDPPLEHVSSLDLSYRINRGASSRGVMGKTVHDIGN
jgi:hypothetical protein